MAEIISTTRLRELLAEHDEAGGGFAWIDRTGALLLGLTPASPQRRVDFGLEALVSPEERPTPAPHAGREEPARSLGIADYLIVGDSTSGRQTGLYRLVIEGRTFALRSAKQLLLVALEEIDRLSPGTLEKLSREKARTKRVVARDRAALNRNPELARKFSRQISDGWWVFTNNSAQEVEKFVLRAAFLGGLHVKVQKEG